MDSQSPGRFPEIIHIQTPSGMNRAFNQLASQRHQTKSECVRRALLRELADAGVVLGTPNSQAAGG
jgi:hypothetical protein